MSNKKFTKRILKAQSILEYTILIIAVATAFMAMNLYVRRAVNARLHNLESEINPGIMITTGSTAEPPSTP